MKHDSFSAYDDDYPTCQKTYATLCVYLHGSLDDPNAVSEQLGLTPTKIQAKRQVADQVRGSKGDKPIAWFLETSSVVQSRDVRRHIDWLLSQLAGRLNAIQQLQNAGCQMSISCFWVSAHGHGGPMLSPDMIKRLAEFKLGIDFDVYIGDDISV